LSLTENIASTGGWFPLSPVQLAEFLELRKALSDDAQKNLTAYKIVASPRLSEEKRTNILEWMSKKRAQMIRANGDGRA
jgi:hypothetical protein